MRKIASEAKLCKICMEQHDVDVVEVMDEEIFKGEEVVFKATYEYCPNADEYLETEEMVKRNSLAMKDAYRQKVGYDYCRGRGFKCIADSGKNA